MFFSHLQMKLLCHSTHCALIQSILLGIVAASCYIICSIEIKKNPQILWIGLGFSGLFPCIFYIYKPPKSSKEDKKQHYCESVSAKCVKVLNLGVEAFSGCIHVISNYFVLLFLQLGDAIVLANGLQMFGMIAGEYIILSRKPSKISTACAGIILIGVVLVVKPPVLFQYFTIEADQVNESSETSGSAASRGSYDSLIGVTLCSMMSFFGIVFYTCIAKHYYISSAVHTANQGILILLTCILLHFLTQYPHSLIPCLYAVRLSAMIIALSQFVGQFAAIVSNQMSSPLFALIIRLVVIPIGYFVQVFYLDEPITLLSLVGGTIIVAAIIVQSCVNFALTRSNTELVTEE